MEIVIFDPTQELHKWRNLRPGDMFLLTVHPDKVSKYPARTHWFDNWFGASFEYGKCYMIVSRNAMNADGTIPNMPRFWVLGPENFFKEAMP